MKFVLALALVFLGTAAFATTNSCTSKFEERFKFYDSKSFGQLTAHMFDYEELDKFFAGDKVNTVSTMVVSAVGAPFLVLLDAMVSAVDSTDARYWKDMTAYLKNQDSSEPALQRMHALVKNEFDISAEELSDLLRFQGESWFCERGPQLVLSEEGRQLMGDMDMFEFAYKYHNTPEWKRFWENPANMATAMVTKPLEEEEIESRLFAFLDSRKIARGSYRAKANWKTKESDVSENGRKAP